VSFTAPASYPQHAWVGIAASKTPHGSAAVNDQANLGYEYLDFRTAGVAKLKAPTQAGAYDIRLNDADGDVKGAKEVASISITVGSK